MLTARSADQRIDAGHFAVPMSSGRTAQPGHRVAGARWRIDAPLTARLLVWADWLALAVAATAAAMIGRPDVPLASLTLADAAPILFACLCLKAALWAHGAYEISTLGEPRRTPLVALGLGAPCAIELAIVVSPTGDAMVALSAALVAVAIVIGVIHYGARRALAHLQAIGALSDKVVIIGATEAARRFIRKNAERPRVEIVAIFDDRADRAPPAIEGVPVFGDVGALLAWQDLPEIDQVVVAVSPTAELRVRDLITRLRVAPNRVALLFDLDALTPEPARLDRLADTPAALVAGGARDIRFEISKRLQDLVIGGAMFMCFLPVMAIVALAVRLDSPGPVFFRQRRHGFNNRIITVWKFRTMRHETCDAAAAVQVSAGDTRVTRLGAFLRRTSLDELPQLWNVLMGDMSLVGPRPHAIAMRTGEVESSRLVAEYAHRCRMKPGLTGWAQIQGSRGPLDTAEDVRERVRLDLDYIERASLWLDLTILARTAPALLGDKLRVR